MNHWSTSRAWLLPQHQLLKLFSSLSTRILPPVIFAGFREMKHLNSLFWNNHRSCESYSLFPSEIRGLLSYSISSPFLFFYPPSLHIPSLTSLFLPLFFLRPPLHLPFPLPLLFSFLLILLSLLSTSSFLRIPPLSPTFSSPSLPYSFFSPPFLLLLSLFRLPLLCSFSSCFLLILLHFLSPSSPFPLPVSFPLPYPPSRVTCPHVQGLILPLQYVPSRRPAAVLSLPSPSLYCTADPVLGAVSLFLAELPFLPCQHSAKRKLWETKQPKKWYGDWWDRGFESRRWYLSAPRPVNIQTADCYDFSWLWLTG